MPKGRQEILIDEAYMKSAGEKTAIQSWTDGLDQPYFTVTHSVSSPCHRLKFEKQHVHCQMIVFSMDCMSYMGDNHVFSTFYLPSLVQYMSLLQSLYKATIQSKKTYVRYRI
jgi:hypothetical protein